MSLSPEISINVAKNYHLVEDVNISVNLPIDLNCLIDKVMDS